MDYENSTTDFTSSASQISGSSSAKMAKREDDLQQKFIDVLEKIQSQLYKAEELDDGGDAAFWNSLSSITKMMNPSERERFQIETLEAAVLAVKRSKLGNIKEEEN